MRILEAVHPSTMTKPALMIRSREGTTRTNDRRRIHYGGRVAGRVFQRRELTAAPLEPTGFYRRAGAYRRDSQVHWPGRAASPPHRACRSRRTRAATQARPSVQRSVDRQTSHRLDRRLTRTAESAV